MIQATTSARIPTPMGTFRLFHYVNDVDTKEHLALVLGDVAGGERVLVRVHSECITGEVFGSLRCDCGEQLQMAMQRIAGEGSGVVIYLRQEGRGIGLAQKLRAYNLQDQGYDTVDANLLLGHQADEREYWAAAGIMANLQLRSVRLLTNNPAKIEHLRAQGIDVVERVSVEPSVHAENAAYLEAKVRRMHHLLQLPPAAPATVIGQALPHELVRRVSILREQARAFATESGLPFVTMSYAQSLDGSIASMPGRPLALSGPTALTLTHALRAAHDAILVGVGTVLADDPRLTVRMVAGPDPQPVTLDSRLRFPATARLLAHPRGVWIATTPAARATASALPAAHARIIEVAADNHGRVDLRALLRHLATLGIRSIMVEGGAQVLASFVEQRLAHYFVVTIAPRLVGGLSPFRRPESNGTIRAAMPQLRRVEYTQAGQDLVVWGESDCAA